MKDEEEGCMAGKANDKVKVRLHDLHECEEKESCHEERVGGKGDSNVLAVVCCLRPFTFLYKL